MSANAKYEEVLNGLNQNERAACHNYFTKREAINKVLDVVRAKNILKRSPFGNANAKTFFVVDFDKTNDPCIEIIKRYFSANKIDPYLSYFTQFTKTEDTNVNFALLKKELEIVQPHRVVFITDTAMPEIEGSKSMTRAELETVLRYGKIKDSATESETKAFSENRVKLNALMQFAIMGR